MGRFLRTGGKKVMRLQRWHLPEFIPRGNIDGTDQPAHPPSLINIFVVHNEDSFVLIQNKCRIL